MSINMKFGMHAQKARFQMASVLFGLVDRFTGGKRSRASFEEPAAEDIPAPPEEPAADDDGDDPMLEPRLLRKPTDGEMEQGVAAKAKSIAKQEREACRWISDVTGRPQTAPLGEWLQDGTVLCELVNAMKHGVVPKIDRSEKKFKHLDNIAQFARACKARGSDANRSKCASARAFSRARKVCCPTCKIRAAHFPHKAWLRHAVRR